MITPKNKQKVMMISLIVASFFQLLAIIGEQYVLQINFDIELTEQNITATHGLRDDLDNIRNILRYASRYRDDTLVANSFEKEYGLKVRDEKSGKEINEAVSFMRLEVEKLYKLLSIESPIRSNDQSNIISKNQLKEWEIYIISEPLFKKINANQSFYNSLKIKLTQLKNNRHVILILTIVAQMLGLFGGLLFFLFLVKRTSG